MLFFKAYPSMNAKGVMFLSLTELKCTALWPFDRNNPSQL